MQADLTKVLTICDNPENLIALSVAARQAWPQVVIITASDGPQSLALASAEAPDVIVVDVEERGATAPLDACTLLKSDDSTMHIPMIALVGQESGSKGRIGLLNAGANVCLMKPVDVEELIAQIRAVVQDSDASVQAPQQHARIVELLAERTAELEREATERGRIGDALRESEERLALLFDRAPLGYQSLDADGCFLSVNQAWLEILQYSLDEVVGRWFGDFLAPDYVDAFRERFPKFKEAGHVRTGFEMVRKDGSHRFVAFEGRIGHKVDGSFMQTHCILSDITEQKRAEEALRESEDKFKYIFDHSVVAMSITFPSGEHDPNPAFAEMLGYTRAELRRLPWQEITHPDDIGLSRRMIDSLRRGEKDCVRFTKRYLRRDGGVVWVDDNTNLRRDEAGRPVYFITTLNDVTARVLAEAELRKEKERAQGYLDIAAVMLVGFDPALRVTLINRRGAEILGRRQEDIVGKQWSETLVPLRVRDRVTTILRQLAAGEIESAEYHENPVLTAGGEERLIAWHNAVLRDDAGQITGILSSGEDITERRRAEESLRESEERFRAIASNTPDHIVMQDCQLRYTFVANPLWGFTEQDMLGKTDYDFLSAEEAEALSRVKTRVLESGQAEHLETSLTSLDGKPEHFAGAYIPTFDAHGHVSGLIGYFRNVTEKMQADAALRESEVKFRTIAEQLTDMVYMTDEAGIITFASSAVKSLFGVTPAEMEGRSFTEFLVETEIPKAIAAFETAIAVGQAGKNVELQMLRAGGSTFVGELSGTIFRRDDIRGTMGLIRDVTERKRAEEALAANARKQAVVAELGQLALGVTDLQSLCGTIVERVALTLGTEYCGVLELMPDGRALRMIAGWPAIPSPSEVGVGPSSQAGFTLLTNEPVIVEDTRCETRFSVPQVLQDYGVVSSIAVVIPGASQPYGVLAAYALEQRAFSSDDASFFQAVANVLAEAIRHKLAEEALHESEERFRAVVETAPDAIFIQTEGCFAYLNPAAIELFGVSDSGCLVGRPVLDRFHPDYRATIAGRIRLINETRRGVSPLVEKILRGDGRVVDVEVTGVPFIHQGQAGALVFARDITERMQAEVERARLLAQVQAQAMQIVQIMETVPEGVVLLDLTGTVLLANPAGRADLGLLAGATVGGQLTHLGEIPFSEVLVAAAAGEGQRLEIQVGQRIFELLARPAVATAQGDRQDSAEQWVLVIDEVTQVRAFRDQAEQQERLAAIGQLAAGIAHDFNNILAVIALYTPMVARSPGLGERDRERLATISDQTTHATRLIQQLLDFSRRSVLERRPLDLERLLQEQLSLLSRTLPESIQVTLTCEPGEHLVLADPTRLQQMVMNLALNARDAMPGGGTLSLALTRSMAHPRSEPAAGSRERLVIADNGEGIAPEALARLFEPFFTTKPRGQGTGLGLAQVYGIVKQHDGEIFVESSVGLGTTFTVYLPAIPAGGPLVQAAEAMLQVGNGETILIVEDNPVLLEAMREIVELLGYAVVVAHDGLEALAVLEARAEAIALVLSDLVMPKMGGDALLDGIRSRGLMLPVVILSGHPLESELIGLKERGLTGWMLKPPKPEDLGRLIAQALAESR